MHLLKYFYPQVHLIQKIKMYKFFQKTIKDIRIAHFRSGIWWNLGQAKGGGRRFAQLPFVSYQRFCSGLASVSKAPNHIGF
jgi:hypothetical protein